MGNPRNRDVGKKFVSHGVIDSCGRACGDLSRASHVRSRTPAATVQSTEAELIVVRREKLAKLRELGIDPFGERYEVSTTPAGLRADFAEGKRVKIAGRITALRDMGKSVFFQLGDVLGSIQGYVGIKNLTEDQAAAWKCLDRGDWLGIEGETFLTSTGEPTVKVENFTVLSKALRPMPDKFHGLADRETNYRKRHLDLMGNPDSATLFVTRSLMLAEIRRFSPRPRIPRSGNADASGHPRRRGGATLRDIPQRARHAAHPAHRAGAVSQAVC